MPGDLRPSVYQVDLRPYLEPDADGKFWFDGTSSVTFTVVKATDYIYIHSNRLDINSIGLTAAEVFDFS